MDSLSSLQQDQPRWALFIAFVIVAGMFIGCDDSEPQRELPPEEAPASYLALPTQNEALFEGDGPAFYQYVNRRFQGRRSRPWQAGQYGFVRNPRKTTSDVVYTRFHEGIDIKSLHRSEAGDALDTVRAVDEGTVAYTNRSAGRSNYGNYVVVKHEWQGSPFYSLYAHLSQINVRQGQPVRQGEQLGIMGYTGRGLNRERAHLHLEIGMLVNQNFQRWFEHYYGDARNWHGLYSGLNLAGLDVAALYRAQREQGASFDIRDFVRQQEVFFSVLIPGPQPPDMVHRYPWLVQERAGNRAPSWKIAFTQTGLPIRIMPSDRKVNEPTLLDAAPSDVPYRYRAKGFLAGQEGNVHLTRDGKKAMDLFSAKSDAS